MLKKQHNKSCAKLPPKDLLPEREKEYLDLLCSFIVDDIINKVNDDKEESYSLRKDQ